MKPAATPCDGCVHYYAAYRVNLCCNYIFDKGHSRPCPPGALCTVKQPRRKGVAIAASSGEQKF